MTFDEQLQVQKILGENLLKIFIANVKAGTSWRNKENVYFFLGESWGSGIFTGLDKFYTKDDFQEILEELWDEFD